MLYLYFVLRVVLLIVLIFSVFRFLWCFRFGMLIRFGGLVVSCLVGGLLSVGFGVYGLNCVDLSLL